MQAALIPRASEILCNIPYCVQAGNVTTLYYHKLEDNKCLTVLNHKNMQLYMRCIEFYIYFKSNTNKQMDFLHHLCRSCPNHVLPYLSPMLLYPPGHSNHSKSHTHQTTINAQQTMAVNHTKTKLYREVENKKNVSMYLANYTIKYCTTKRHILTAWFLL